MKGSTLIGIVIIAGAGALAWYWYRSSNRMDNGRIIPQPSSFDYAAAIPQQTGRTAPIDATITGNAIPRDPTVTYPTTGTRGHV